MRRFPDWEIRLHKFCSQRMRAPFEWGNHDCAIFVADCIKETTGEDLAAECRGKYDSKETATALLWDLVGAGLEQYAEHIAELHGMKEVDIYYAQRGDMVLYIQDSGPSLGIVSLDGQRALIAVENGDCLLRVPVLKCARAWRVG
jgi:hypothetical protein